MQPDQPDPCWIVVFIFDAMIRAAGAKEVKLQGSSSFVRRNVTLENHWVPLGTSRTMYAEEATVTSREATSSTT